MKYNEKNLTDIFKKQESIWNTDDLDWFDSQLVYKLQNNELSIQEKDMLVEMMANDQTVLNRYLQLKQYTAPVKESIVERFFSAFKTPKSIPLLATGLALIISLVVVFKQTNENISFGSDLVRGIPQASIYPADNSLIKEVPEFFIINNKHSQKMRLQLNIDNAIVWVSEIQQSNKFYLPRQIQQKLIPGDYSWSVIDKNEKIITKNSFTIY